MQKTLIYKFLMIGGLAILLLVPLAMIQGIIHERQSYRQTVISEIGASSTGAQRITGAILVAPYKETITRENEIYEDGKKQTVFKEEQVRRYHYYLPEALAINGNVLTEERYRGIYKIPVYTAGLKLKGHFDLPQHLDIKENLERITWEKPYLVLGIQDIRGINRSVRLAVNQQDVPFLPGTQTEFFPQGIHAPLNIGYDRPQRLAFDIDLELQGMQQLSFLPTGKFTKVNLTSPWPHPSFTGKFLPKTREVTDLGFAASWETSFFASNMLQYLQTCTQTAKCYEFEANHFGVSLHQGVDQYLQAERSVKYALLFIGLTFVAFFLFEVLKGLPIHPIQYGLVGMALALFYLLLISLSEHIAFGLAYAIASTACVSLLGFYVSFVLRSMIRGAVFGGALCGLYGALYLLTRSEDYALLMGSGLLFGVLAFIMALTRQVDWYKIEASTRKQLGVSNIQVKE